MSYNFKTLQELIWAAAVAVITYLSTATAAGVPADKAAWIALAAGAGRAVLAALVAFVNGGFSGK